MGYGSSSNNRLVKSVEKYSFKENTWQHVADMHHCNHGFCASAFIDQIFVFSSYFGSSCIKFNTKNNKWKIRTSMNDARWDAACTVFQGRVAVSGGFNFNNQHGLNTVGAYDHVADAWSYLPNMIHRRRNHGCTAVNRRGGSGSQFQLCSCAQHGFLNKIETTNPSSYNVENFFSY